MESRSMFVVLLRQRQSEPPRQGSADHTAAKAGPNQSSSPDQPPASPEPLSQIQLVWLTKRGRHPN